jgi:endothelin-converting enzyme/putative endopeptidase
MRTRRFSLALTSLVGLSLYACGGHEAVAPQTPIAVLPATPWTPAPTTSAEPVTTAPKLPPPGVDEAAIDASVDPCDDFYAYACGGWQKATTIPNDRAQWTRSFSEIDQRNEKMLRDILAQAAEGKAEPGSAYADKLGAAWKACMDEAGIEARGQAPLKGPFAVVERAKDAAGLAAAIRELWSMGFTPLFSFYSGQDFADATQVIGQLEQGGLGLPDRDYYLKTDAKNVETRKAYVEHVGKLLGLAGETGADAAAIVALETELAKASMTRVDRRDPKKTYHRMALPALKTIAPSLSFEPFFDALGVARKAPVNVAQPDFFKGVEQQLKKTKPETWRAYLKLSIVRELAPMLPKAFVDQEFAFRSKHLTGAKEILPRWKRCVDAVDGELGEALAQPFVKATFGAEGKERTSRMIAEIERAMEKDLTSLSWMDEPTRKKAFDKLRKINNKIGYPDAWRSYDALEIGPEYATNALHASAFELRRQLAKIGKPVDRKEWFMTPPTVNAYYDATLNEMVFPAGILQPPFFDNAAPPGSNYGAIGLVMGHELTHGFDDEGRQFDGDGNLKDWWSKKVGAEFDRRAQCLVDQFDGYVAVDELHVNGKLTLGENIADLGGLKLSYAAFEDATAGKPPATPGKFAPAQEFFLGFAQAWCQNARPEYVRTLTNTDGHSPPKFRVNGPLSNFAPFSAAFQCKAGKPMVRANKCEVW